VTTSRLDLAILKEIVRIVQEKARVPDRVQILKREYLLTYLEDHRQRMEEALRRYDMDRVNMLFGQLASKVKYQQARPARKAAKTAAKKTVAKVPKAAKVQPATTPAPAAKRKATRTQPAARPKTAAQPKRAPHSRAAAARTPKSAKRVRAR